MSFLWVGLGTAALTAGASVYGANKQAKGAEKSAGLNMDMFKLLTQQQQPFVQGGYGAMGRLNTLLGLNPRPGAASSFPAQSPGFRPTPGGGVEPIMQAGLAAPAHDVHIPRPPPRLQAASATSLRDLLAMRAMNGDRQAQAMLRGGV